MCISSFLALVFLIIFLFSLFGIPFGPLSGRDTSLPAKRGRECRQMGVRNLAALISTYRQPKNILSMKKTKKNRNAIEFSQCNKEHVGHAYYTCALPATSENG